MDFKRVSGGFLVQTRDAVPEGAIAKDVVTTRHPTLEEVTSLLFAWRAVKHVTSNGVVLAKGLALVGFGTGQPSRQDAVVERWHEHLDVVLLDDADAVEQMLLAEADGARRAGRRRAGELVDELVDAGCACRAGRCADDELTPC